MKSRIASRLHFFYAAILLAALFITATAPAASTNSPLRITSWNFGPKSPGDNNAYTLAAEKKLIHKGVELLKKLNPDIVLLQQIASQEDCQELVEALKPEVYHVAVCSSFWDTQAEMPSRRQVAILSKSAAVEAWTAPWQTKGAAAASGGLAFAEVQIGAEKIGFLSIQVADDSAMITNDFVAPAQEEQLKEILNQLGTQISSLRSASSNGLHSMMLAGDFNANEDAARFFRTRLASRLKHLGFDYVFPDREADKNGRPNAADCLMALNVGHISNLQVSPAGGARFRPATCDTDLNIPTFVPPPAVVETNMPKVEALSKVPTPAIAAPIAPPAAVPAHTNASAAALAIVPSVADNRMEIFAGIGVVLVLFASILFLLLRQGRAVTSRAMVIVNSDGGIVSETAPPTSQSHEEVRRGLMAQMSRWLKERMIRRLANDRAQLLVAQDVAAAKMLAVDERLASVERQIQNQTQDYEQRIEVLQKELSNAKEENRELIRAQIRLLQLEMEKARVKTRAPLN